MSTSNLVFIEEEHALGVSIYVHSLSLSNKHRMEKEEFCARTLVRAQFHTEKNENAVVVSCPLPSPGDLER